MLEITPMGEICWCGHEDEKHYVYTDQFGEREYQDCLIKNCYCNFFEEKE